MIIIGCHQGGRTQLTLGTNYNILLNDSSFLSLLLCMLDTPTHVKFLNEWVCPITAKMNRSKLKGHN